MKAIKILVGVMVFVAVLLVGLSVAANYFIDLNKYTPQIETRLAEETGLEWTVKGPLKFAFLPGLSISLENITAQDTGKAKFPQLAGQSFAFAEAKAKIAWFPHILSKQVIIKDVSLLNFDLSQNSANGEQIKLSVERFALQGIFVGFADLEKSGPDIRPNKAGSGVPIYLSMSAQMLDAKGVVQNDVALSYKARIEKKKELVSGSGDFLVLKDSALDVKLKNPALKPAGIALKVNADVALDLQRKIVDILALQAVLANQKIEGGARLDLSQSIPAIDFKLTGKDIQTDAILALLAPKQDAASSADKADTAKKAAMPKPLPNVTINGQITLDGLTANNLKIDRVDAVVKGNDSSYSLAPLSLDLYAGKAIMLLSVNGKSVPARCALDLNAGSIALGALLQDVSGENIFEGALNTKADIKLPCLAGPVDISKAVGTVNTIISDGVIQKWQVSKALNQALAVAKAYDEGSLSDLAGIQNALNVKSDEDRFEFAEMLADVTLKGGVANNTLFKMIAPLSEINGQGSVDLVKKLIDYRLQLSLTNKKSDKAVFIPVKIGGSLSKPTYGIDTQSLLKAQAQNKVEDLVQDKLKGVVGDKLGKDLLKSLPF
jgi:uncharacterized protein involved in outer membrane biogenesis